jgi:hypothetical protein
MKISDKKATKKNPAKLAVKSAVGNVSTIDTNILEIFAENFNAALDNNHYPSLNFGRQVEVHKNFSISLTAARKWVMAGSLPDIPNLIKIADKLNVSLDFLFGRIPRYGNEPMVSIPIHSPQGNNNEPLEAFSAIQMEPTWIENGMRMKHNNLSLMLVNSDNMNPTFAEGDIVFVDSSPISDILELEDNGIFLIMAHGRPQIRRIVFNFDKTISLNSDNKEYPMVQLPITAFSINPNDEAPNLKVLGKITWAIHRVGKQAVTQFNSKAKLHPTST